METKRLLAILLCLSGSVACAHRSTLTLNGEPLLAGGDPNAVVDTIDVPGLPAVMMSSDHGEISVGVYQAGTGQTYATLADRNSDGVFDLIVYHVLSTTGEILVQVEDYGMDGQPDFRWNRKESRASVFYQGEWHVVQGIGSVDTIVEVDGNKVPLQDLITELRENAF